MLKLLPALWLREINTPLVGPQKTVVGCHILMFVQGGEVPGVSGLKALRIIRITRIATWQCVCVCRLCNDLWLMLGLKKIGIWNSRAGKISPIALIWAIGGLFFWGHFDQDTEHPSSLPLAKSSFLFMPTVCSKCHFIKHWGSWPQVKAIRLMRVFRFASWRS